MEKTGTTISVATGKNIASSSQLSMFNVLQDMESDVKLLNIWRTYTVRNSITESIIYYDLYEVADSDWWDSIAYKVYGDVNYWWIVALVNRIENPFEQLEPGQQLKILKKSYVFQLLREIKGVASL